MKVVELVSEILEDEYVEEKLESSPEHQPKTERGKWAKAKRDALNEPVKIAEKMVDASNCEKQLSAIALKEKAKKCIAILLTNIPAFLDSQ